MDMFAIAQILGWIAALTATVSYAFKNIRQIRIVNCIAAVFFIIYGALIASPAIIIGNATLAAVHIAYLASDDKFGDLLSSHRKAMWIVFAAYAVFMVSFTYIGTVSLIEVLGTVSAVGFVGGFLLNDEKSMRIVCSIFIVSYIVYAGFIASAQMAFTNGLSLIVNIVQLCKNNKKSVPQIAVDSNKTKIRVHNSGIS